MLEVLESRDVSPIVLLVILEPLVVGVLRLLNPLAALGPMGGVPKRLALFYLLEISQRVVLILSGLVVKWGHTKLLVD